MRNRITYGQSAVFCSSPPAFSDNTESLSGLRRIQNVDVSFNFSRERFKEIGNENYIGDVHLKHPEIKANVNYYYSNGINEALIGLNVNGASGFITKYIKKQNQDRNLYIIFGSGENNNIYDETTILNNYDVCALGNCYLDSYSISASLGEPISVATSFSAYNAKIEIYDDADGKFIPAINTVSGVESLHYKYKLSTGNYLDVGGIESAANPALSPTRIEFNLPTGIKEPGLKFSGQQTSLLQNFELGFNIDRNDLYGFGSMYPYGRRAIFPILCNLSFSAISQEFQTGSLYDIITKEKEEYDFTFNFRNCDGATGLQIEVQKSLIDSESLQQSIGQNGTIDISMSFPISNTTGLKISTPPLILSHASTDTPGGGILSVSVTGKTPFAYQWYDDNGSPQIGETGPSIIPATTGVYYCVINNELGSGISRQFNYPGPTALLSEADARFLEDTI